MLPKDCSPVTEIRMNEYSHLPVMVNEIVSFLTLQKDGSYIDLTAGLGGHLKAFSANLSQDAKLFGTDRDRAAVEIARQNLTDCPQQVVIAEVPYSTIDKILPELSVSSFDGILLDLGLSSLQIDDAARGFSFQEDGPLDMRFDPQLSGRTAGDLLNESSEKELTEIFFSYGEEKQARRIAKAIVKERQKGVMETTMQLKQIIDSVIFPPYQKKTLARIFQSLRIALNSELDELKTVLPKLIPLLNQSGRLAVLSYHSLEDRIVKRFFQQMHKGCVCPPEFAVCVCGIEPSLKILTKKALIPTSEEIKANPRARSAKLRVAEKI